MKKDNKKQEFIIPSIEVLFLSSQDIVSTSDNRRSFGDEEADDILRFDW